MRSRAKHVAGYSDGGIWWATAFAIHLLTGCGDDAVVETECVRSEECAYLLDQGNRRCPAREALCDQGTCRLACPPPGCILITRALSPCEGDLICDVARVDANSGRCRGAPIPCAVANDCPLYLPTPEGEWSCEQGICRFPGFEYPYP